LLLAEFQRKRACKGGDVTKLARRFVLALRHGYRAKNQTLKIVKKSLVCESGTEQLTYLPFWISDTFCAPAVNGDVRRLDQKLNEFTERR
jgi:hypothetical protein